MGTALLKGSAGADPLVRRPTKFASVPAEMVRLCHHGRPWLVGPARLAQDLLFTLSAMDSFRCLFRHEFTRAPGVGVLPIRAPLKGPKGDCHGEPDHWCEGQSARGPRAQGAGRRPEGTERRL